MSFNQIDYRHYLDQNKLKESDRFQPVFEAVENAFNAIEERLRLEPGSPEGLVTITINRRAEQRTIGDQKSRGQFTPPDIAGFTIIDNGVGFRDENWAAVKTVYTSHKKLQGGKGVGRLSFGWHAQRLCGLGGTPRGFAGWVACPEALRVGWHAQRLCDGRDDAPVDLQPSSPRT